MAVCNTHCALFTCSLLAGQLLKENGGEWEGRLEVMEIPEVSTYHHLPVEGVDPVCPDALFVGISNY